MKKGWFEMKRFSVEIKVGSFFIVATLLFFIALLSIRQVTFFKGAYTIRVKFDFVEGLRSASPVRYCGADVGEVKKVEVKDEGARPFVYVYTKITEDTRIPKNSHFLINSLSLFGEKYLEIIAPSQPQGYFKDNDIAEGLSPKPLFNVLVDFDKAMQELHAFIKEEKIRTSFENTLTNVEEITFKIKGIVDDIKSKQGNLGKFLYDDSLYRKTEELMDDLKRHPWKLLHKTKEKKK